MTFWKHLKWFINTTTCNNNVSKWTINVYSISVSKKMNDWTTVGLVSIIACCFGMVRLHWYIGSSLLFGEESQYSSTSNFSEYVKDTTWATVHTRAHRQKSHPTTPVVNHLPHVPLSKNARFIDQKKMCTRLNIVSLFRMVKSSSVILETIAWGNYFGMAILWRSLEIEQEVTDNGIIARNVFGTFFKKYFVEWVNSWVVFCLLLILYLVLLLVWVRVEILCGLVEVIFFPKYAIMCKPDICEPKCKQFHKWNGSGQQLRGFDSPQNTFGGVNVVPRSWKIPYCGLIRIRQKLH